MIQRILIKIGAKTIKLFTLIKNKNINLRKKDLTNKSIQEETINEILNNNKKDKIPKYKDKNIIILIFLLLILCIFLKNLIIPLITIIISLIILKFIKPKLKDDKRKKEILKTLPYVLREMSTELKAGIGLFDTMKTISEGNYGVLSEEFKITLEEIHYGTNYEEAFNNLSRRTNISILRKISNQIIRTLNNGGNLSHILSSIADENVYNLKIKYKEYSEKLNSLMLLYLFIAVLIPVIVFILIIAATTVMGSIIKPELLIILYLFFFPMIIIFMIFFIKEMEPTI